MATKKIKRETLTTPPGILKFGWIDKPNTKFNKDGEYSTDLLLDKADPAVQTLIDGLTTRAEKARADATTEAKDGKSQRAIMAYDLSLPFSDEEDDDGNPTGNVILKCKNKARFTIKKLDGSEEVKERTINVFDAKGKKTTARIGRGSKLRVAFTPFPFCAPGLKKVGVTLWLEAVQVLDLKTFGGGDAGSYGFGAEDGYTADDETPAEEPVAAAGGEGSADGDY